MTRPILSIDIETTGFGADAHVIEWGACLLAGGRAWEPVGMLVRPARKSALQTFGARQAQRVHRIHPDQIWSEGMAVSDAVARVNRYLAAIGDRFGEPPQLAAWGAQFEARFLSAPPWSLSPWRDLLADARARCPERSCHKLQSMAKVYGVRTGRAHRAPDDARTAALVALRLGVG